MFWHVATRLLAVAKPWCNQQFCRVLTRTILPDDAYKILSAEHVEKMHQIEIGGACMLLPSATYVCAVCRSGEGADAKLS